MKEKKKKRVNYNDDNNDSFSSRLPSFSMTLMTILVLYLILVFFFDDTDTTSTTNSNYSNTNYDNINDNSNNNNNDVTRHLRINQVKVPLLDDANNNTNIIMNITNKNTFEMRSENKEHSDDDDNKNKDYKNKDNKNDDINKEIINNDNNNNIANITTNKRRLKKVEDVLLLPITKIEDIPDKVGNPVYIKWNDFLKIPHEKATRKLPARVPSDPTIPITLCNNKTVVSVKTPMLSQEDYDWCQWTFTSGGVIVGKSYGNLQANDRNKYERLNCNAVSFGKNPSCDHSFGDNHILEWKAKKIPNLCETKSEGSKVHCFDSISNARFCFFENVMIDYSKMHDENRGGRSTKTRNFESGFLKSDCDNKYSDINFYEVYSPGLDKENTVCDYVFNETVLMYSHDNIRNLGHTMSDMMNVWLMLWLADEAQNIRDISFLNMDALRLGHNYDDDLGAFGLHYKTAFKKVYKAIDFGSSKVCFKKLIMQSRPLLLFTWDGWWQDMPCTFKGPSTMFQQWNMQIRQNYGLLTEESIKTNKRMQILLIIRTTTSNDAHYSSRVYSNTNQIIEALNTFTSKGISVVVQDLVDLKFPDQIKLISESSIIVGMHGAGITHLTHMSIGSKYCCGVIEIFPNGEFSSIKGHGNMARRMGHAYESMHLREGSNVPTTELLNKLDKMIQKIEKGDGSCLMPTAVNNPYFLLD